MAECSRRRFLQLGAAAATGLSVSACAGSSLGGAVLSGDGPIKVGLIWPQSGVYKALGDDQQAGWRLYTDGTAGRLGGREVQAILVDEGETPETAKAAAEKLIKRDQVVAAVGVISSASLLAIQPMFQAAKTPLISTNASPSQVQAEQWCWRTSFCNNHAGVALGGYIAEHIDGPVALVAADYAAGRDYLDGMRATFEPEGGKVRNGRMSSSRIMPRIRR